MADTDPTFDTALWSAAKQQICADIAKHGAPMKLLVKVKNETSMLEAWIAHHERIVGRANLIVFDNLSDSTEARDYLENLGRVMPVFRYSGFHNHIHDRGRYPELYEALRQSCGHYMFMDADERLVFVDGNKWIGGSGILEKLKDLGESSLIPSALIANFALREDLFQFDSSQELAQSVAAWGKPVIPAGLELPTGPRLHNCQFPAEKFGPSPRLHFLTLHLCRLDPERRSQVNRLKLSARGIKLSESGHLRPTSRKRAARGHTAAFRRLTRELREIAAFSRNPEANDWGPTDPTQSLLFHKDGRIEFGAADVSEAFGALLNKGLPNFDESNRIETDGQ